MVEEIATSLKFCCDFNVKLTSISSYVSVKKKKKTLKFVNIPRLMLMAIKKVRFYLIVLNF